MAKLGKACLHESSEKLQTKLQWAKSAGRILRTHRYPLDTYQRAIWYFAERDLAAPENYRLLTLAAHFGLDTEGAHDALADVRLAAGVARAIAELELPR